MVSTEQIAAWRRDTPGCRDVIHLNNAGAALMPRVVVDAMVGHLERESRLGGYEAADLVRDAVTSVYEQVATLIGARARNVALVENATVAYAQALSAIDWKAGDRILTTRADYASHQLMFLRLGERLGVEVEFATDAPEGGADPESVDRMLGARRFALVAVTWLPTNSGLVQDVAAIGAACARHGVPYLVDACQAVGQLPVDVASLHCDYLAATARKFLRGPRGIGFLQVSDAVLGSGAAPLLTDMRGATWTAADRMQLAPDAKRFENWESSYALVLGMGAAVRYALEQGIEVTGRRARMLADRLRDHVTEVPGVSVLDRGVTRSAIVSLALHGLDPFAVVAALRPRNIHVWAIPREHAIFDMDQKRVTSVLRVSPHYYNTEEELDAFVAALREITTSPSARASSS